MKAFWKARCNAKSHDKAQIMARRIFERLGHAVVDDSIEPHAEGGFVIDFCTTHAVQRWNDFVMSVIELGQRVARDWSILGDIRDQADGLSTHSAIPGVTFTQWICDKQLIGRSSAS